MTHESNYEWYIECEDNRVFKVQARELKEAVKKAETMCLADTQIVSVVRMKILTTGKKIK